MAIKLNGVDITSNKLNNVDILVERLNNTIVYDARPPLYKPQGSLTDKFDYDDGLNWYGGVMLIALYNSNTESVRLRGRILFGGNEVSVSQFSHFAEAGGFFFGDNFPPNTGLDYGLSVIANGLFTYEWLYPVTVEVWFEPEYGSTYSASDKLIITINS